MDPAQSAPVPPAPDVSFAVEYQTFAGAYNPDLKGRGFFSVVGGGDAYLFSGRKRDLFARGTTELRFSADDIRNVVVAGRAVQFSTSKGLAGKNHKPFVFFCRDADDAGTVAGFLPKHRDEDFVASADFHAKLRELPGAQHPLASVTNLIIATNVAVFLVMAGILGAGWVDVTDLTPYIRYGANNGAATTDGEWWRLLTSMFMHFGIIHLLLNMWALFQSGHLVERLQGRLLYGITYLASGIGGGLLSLGWHGDKMWSAGASGAIFGVYGALLGHMLKEKQSVPRAVFQPLMKSTLTFAGYNLFYGFVHPGIDNAAHIGGFVTGMAFGWLTAMPVDQSVRASLEEKKLRLALVALVVMITVGVVTVPRFDYSVAEELAWSAATKGFVEKEGALIARQNTELTRWKKSADNGVTFGRFIDDELEPFYRGFDQKIEGLVLSPGKKTDERRKALAKFAQLRLEGYQHLSRAIRQNNQKEFAAYTDAEVQATSVLVSLMQAGKPKTTSAPSAPAATPPSVKNQPSVTKPVPKNDGPVAVDAQPVPTFQVRPYYPKEMIEQNLRGEVLVDFVVGEDGGVYSANVIRQTNDQFGLAAVACVTQWRFKPGLKAGIAVKTHMQVPIVFELQDGKENQPKANNGL